jgi:hypothetical protein
MTPLTSRKKFPSIPKTRPSDTSDDYSKANNVPSEPNTKQTAMGIIKFFLNKWSILWCIIALVNSRFLESNFGMLILGGIPPWSNDL